MFAKPISNAGLILLGVACAPWITRLVKSAKVAGFEFELAPSAPPGETATRLAQEVEQTVTGGDGLQTDVNSHDHALINIEPKLSSQAQVGKPELATAEPSPGSGGLLYASGKNLALAYLIEGLVLQDLQEEIGGFLQREVRIPSERGGEARVDALIVAGSEATAVEVKLFTNREPRRVLIDQVIDRMAAMPIRLKHLGFITTHAVVAVVTSDSTPPEQILRLKKDHKTNRRVTVRFFDAHQLLEKYGFNIQ